MGGNGRRRREDGRVDGCGVVAETQEEGICGEVRQGECGRRIAVGDGGWVAEGGVG